MSKKSFFVFLCLVAAPLLAQDPAMTATMARGATQTFTVNTPLLVVISSAPELTLGHTTLPGFNCTESPNVTACRGTMPGTAGSQNITVGQVLSVRSDAALSPRGWTIQVLGDGLSGLRPKVGLITIPSTAPHVTLSSPPEDVVMKVDTNSDGHTAMTLTNEGDASTSVTVKCPARVLACPTINFDTEVTLDLNAKQSKTLDLQFTSLIAHMPAFAIVIVTVEGNGVDPSIATVPVRIAVTDAPAAAPKPEPSTNRIDRAATAGGSNSTGSVTFTNTGAGAAKGVLTSDATWVSFPDPQFSLQPGESKGANFTIDVAKQQKALAATGGIGSSTATLTFRYLLPSSGKGGVTTLGVQPGTGTVSVTLVSTVSPPTSVASVPGLPDTHEQLFLAGVGHAQGSVGLFISDLAIYPQVMRGDANFKTLTIADVDLYFTPLGGGTTSKTTLAAVAPPSVAALGDFVGTVYGETSRIGSLQIRTPGYIGGEGAVGVSANVFNVSNKAGTYGTSIPVFKFGKFQCGAIDLAKKLYLTGLRKDASGHTNFYVQETCGSNAKVTLDFYDPTGAKVGSTTTDVPPFAAVQLSTAVMPSGAVSAILSHAAGSAGGFVAYATPVDELSGDTWAQVDWPNLRNYNSNAAVVIPVAGATPGANNTYFRTDLSIMNSGTAAGAGTLRFYNRNGETTDRTINLNALQTNTYVDVTTTLFGITTPHVGYLTFTPSAGNFVVTSRNYSTPVGSNATFGTAVPTVALNSALKSGQIRRIGGVEDASSDTVGALRGATYRSNFGLIETTGQPVTVKVTAYYTNTSGLTSSINGASATFDLTPRQFVLLGIGSAIFGASRANLGDLHNITLEFEVIGGSGNVLPFVSSVDNGSGDSTFRTE